VDRERLRDLLSGIRSGAVNLEEAEERLRRMPFEELEGMALVDHHRPLRAGIPEVVFGEHKSAEQIAEIMASLAAGGGGALATRVSADKASAVLERLDGAQYHELGRLVVLPPEGPVPDRGRGVVAVAAAGTSDLAVAEEAAVTAEFLGNRVDRMTDIGIAGLHRLVARSDRLRAAEVVIVVAGMEGALPSAVAGLIDRPVIAVPTSVGYGVGLGGFVAMMGMMVSCAPGVSVVNIDNGFGAAVAASLINRKR
jgi:NCAIR mutase (PurE)-related protein